VSARRGDARKEGKWKKNIFPFNRTHRIKISPFILSRKQHRSAKMKWKWIIYSFYVRFVRIYVCVFELKTSKWWLLMLQYPNKHTRNFFIFFPVPKHHRNRNYCCCNKTFFYFISCSIFYSSLSSLYFTHTQKCGSKSNKQAKCILLSSISSHVCKAHDTILW
jgi:hypothetical protein